MRTKMKIRELIAQNIDIDVYDDVCDEIAIAFVGPMALTEEGEKKFGEVMDYDVECISGQETWSGFDHAIVLVDDPDEKVWKKKLRKAKDFFYSIAGECAADDYDKWFKDI